MSRRTDTTATILRVLRRNAASGCTADFLSKHTGIQRQCIPAAIMRLNVEIEPEGEAAVGVDHRYYLMNLEDAAIERLGEAA